MPAPDQRLDSTRCLSADEALTVCGGSDVPPRAALRSHIEACDRCRVLVAEAARALVDVSGHRTGSLLTLSEGEQVAGRYRIVRFLARGGMGEVYEAFDQVLQEPVALKTLLATALDDERAMARLAVEVRLARRVTHPNVCRILEFGFHAPVGWKGARLPFLTMELLAGERLSQRLAREGPLPPDKALDLAGQMIAGLAAIHAAGIVHRDWKADNAFLARSGAGIERLVVMDFGLAHVPAGGRWSQDTPSGIAGTADYIAPEQLQGGPVTPAADVYALGVVLFEMVTGRKPFVGSTTFETALRRLHVDPRPPSALTPGLAASWDRAVLGCLERQPERRFSRVEQVLEALRSTGGRRWHGRRWPRLLTPWRLLALGTPLLLLAALIAWPRGQALRAPPPPEPPAAEALPARVPALARPALLGAKWPVREIPVCRQAVRVSHDPPAAVFTVQAKLDFDWNHVADFWFHDAGSCPPDPRGMIALTLVDGSDYRADLGYRSDGPVRVHLGVELVGLDDRVVHAFGRALGLGLRGDAFLSPEEISFVRAVYGTKPPGSLAGPWGRCLARATGRPSATLARCSGGEEEAWRPDRRTRLIRSADGRPVCLAAGQAGVKKQPLLISDCRGGAREVTSLRGASWRAVGDRCATAVAARADAEIGIAGCDNRPLQRWDFFQGDDRIRLSGTDLCVTAPSDAVARGVGTRLRLEPCRAGSGTQVFQFPPGGLIKLDLTTDLCLTMSMGTPRTGVLSLGTWCDRAPASPDQVFSVAGPLRAAGGCVTVPGIPDDHAPVWVMPCVGGWDHQLWEYWW
jgi:tRNA A-37 threonylcarbamoyl transferase component Bud32